MNITPVRIYINGNGSISFYGPNNTLITNLQNLNGAKQSNGQIIFDGDDKTISFYVYQLTSIESATFSLPYSALDSRFFNPSVYSAKLNSVYQDVAEYVLVNKNGGASFVGGVVAVYPNYASFPATGQEAVIYIDEGTNQAYFWDGTSYQLLVSTGVEQYANFASFPVTGSADVIYIDMSTFESYVWDGAAYEPLTIDTTGFVPYTGATGNVDLGEYELKAGQLELDQTPTGTAGVAVMRWNDTDGTADLGLKGGNVTLQLGQEMLIRAVNKSGGDLLEANYQAVRLRLVSEGGASGQRLAVKLALADSDINSATTIGLVTETILNNQEGFITTIGNVREINTTGSLQGETWVDGDILYLSPTVAGQLTNIKPVAPDHLVVVGYVEYAHAIHGKIYVKCDNGYELDELHNVYINTPTTWQVLRYDATAGYWTNSSLSASILPSGIDASKIGAGTVDNTEFGYLDGVTSSIQTQLDGKVPTTRTLTINGTTQDLSADRTFTIATGLTVGTTPITSGTVGRVLFEDTGNVLQQSANLTYNTSTSTFLINTKLSVFSNASGTFLYSNEELFVGSSTNRRLAFFVNNTEAMRIATTTRNILIGTTTDAGFKLDVNGTARVSGNAQFGTGFYWDNTNNRLGIGTASPTKALTVKANANDDGILLQSATGGTLFQVTRDGASNNTAEMFLYAGGAIRLAIRSTANFSYFNGGNFGIGTTTDAGFKLDVNGTARVQNDLTITDTFKIVSSVNANSKVTFGSNLALQGQSGILLQGGHYITLNGVVFGATSVNASAVLQADSTNRGFLPPRMTTTQKNAIASPAAGLVVYDTTLGKLCVRGASAWETITSL